MSATLHRLSRLRLTLGVIAVVALALAVVAWTPVTSAAAEKIRLVTPAPQPCRWLLVRGPNGVSAACVPLDVWQQVHGRDRWSA